MSSLIVEVSAIENIEPIPNADRIVVAQVRGWNCIVPKGIYNVGDLVVFIPPDSIIPPPIIDKYNLTYLKNGGRVGTAKLKGTVSQGLVLGLDCLPEGKYKAGDDVAKVLGITKWQPPEPTFNKQANPISKKKLNPYFDKYTDIENIKNFNGIFTEDDTVVVLEKVHGSNARFGTLPIVISPAQPLLYRLKAMFKKYILRETHEWTYGSHNVQLHGDSKTNNFYGEDMWGKIAKKYDLKNKIPKDYIVYGEVYGKGVQDLTYGLDEIDLVVFDIKYNGKYLPWMEVVDFCLKRNLPLAPELYIGKYYDGLLQEHTDGKSKLAPHQIREGCVIKDYCESNHPRVGRKILKSISVDYLTRKNGTEYH